MTTQVITEGKLNSVKSFEHSYNAQAYAEKMSKDRRVSKVYIKSVYDNFFILYFGINDADFYIHNNER